MPFSFVADVPLDRGRRCVLLEYTERLAGGPWIGAFYHAPQGIEPRGTVTVAVLLDMLQPAASVEHAGFLILRQAPDLDRLAEFADAMLASTDGFPTRGQASFGGFILWLDQLGGFEIDSVMGMSLVRDPLSGPAREGPTSYRLRPGIGHRLYDARGPGRLLSVTADDLRSATLGPGDDDDDGVGFVIPENLSLAFDGLGPVARLSHLGIDFSGPRAGCLVMRGAVEPGVRGFEPGFQHELVPGKGFGQASTAAPGRVYHPILDPDETLDGVTLELVLDPLWPTTPARNTLAIAPATGSFASAYRTRLAEVVRLAPEDGAHFEAATTYQDRIYLAPTGRFALSVAAGGTGELVGGLSGVEYLGFGPGDALVFVPGQGATVEYDDRDGLRFSPGDDAGHRVSWAALVSSGSTPGAGVWVSASQSAPFFASQDGAASGEPLSFLPVGSRSVPEDAATAAATPYPLLPQAGLEAAAQALEGPGADPGVLAGFELGYANPVRRQALLGLPERPTATGGTVGKAAASLTARASSAASAAPEVHALTPQGYVATFRDGELAALTLGRITPTTGSSGVLRFDAGAGPLPAALTEAFLANQQFIVMSAATPALAHYQASANLGGWHFDLGLPAPDDVVPGKHRSVLIVKSARASVEEMARQPHTWTGYQAFNNAALDPTGATLSTWIGGYIETARTLHDQGVGGAGLGRFLDLVRDPAWNGFLYLRVPVDAGALDPAIQFLLTGVDRDGFEAHHLGCAINRAALEGDQYQADSSYFGLVHYTRPGTDPARPIGDSFVPAQVPFDFQLLALDARFESSTVESFESAARLVANQLFGDPISASSYEREVPASNTLLVLGALQHEAGVPRYAFTTARGGASAFFPISAGFARIDIERARISLDTGGGDDTDHARFRMSGWFGLRDLGQEFDVLSYAGIPFDNLILTMSFPVGRDTGRSASYHLDTSQVTLGRLPERALGADEPVTAATVASEIVHRPGSLASQLPVSPLRLITGRPGQGPESLGYRALATAPDTGRVDFSGSWYGLELALPLGGSGALGAGASIDARLLFAWSAGGRDGACSGFLRIEGPDSGELGLELEGVIRFGAAGVLLTRSVPESEPDTDTAEPGRYVLVFQSIGLTVLSKSFPPAGTTDVFLAGFTDPRGRRTLGWFGAYVAEP